MTTPAVPSNASSLPPVVHRDGEIIPWPHWQYFDGTTKRSLVTPADGLIPKPIVADLSIGIVHGHKWVNSYSDAEHNNQYNATNSGTWRGCPAGHAWISRIIASPPTVINNSVVVKLHYIIRINEFGWDTTWPWFGYFYKDGSDTKAFRTTDGVPYIGFLNADGTKATTPVVSNKQLKRRIDFSVLGF